ncbi:MAG TPA: hypothetical protein VKV03_14700, partial [Candidatus Binataceae bacterium]|nr:hypothetical protein [Candidatus Binataceae bacterium]
MAPHARGAIVRFGSDDRRRCKIAKTNPLNAVKSRFFSCDLRATASGGNRLGVRFIPNVEVLRLRASRLPQNDNKKENRKNKPITKFVNEINCLERYRAKVLSTE